MFWLKVRIYQVKVNPKFGYSKLFSYFWDSFRPKSIVKTMQTNEQMLSAIENYLAQTEFPAEPELLYAPIGYSLAGGGKRLRPMLLMLSHGIFTDDTTCPAGRRGRRGVP